MRIRKYTTCFDDDKKVVLVKESSNNYPSFSRLNNPEIVVDFMNYAYNAKNLTEEHMWLIALDVKCKPSGIFEISHGTVNGTVTSPREIFMRLCLCGASSFMLIHNHPSGECAPSNEDVCITKRIKECGKLMNIELIDHIIIGDGYFSFKENE